VSILSLELNISALFNFKDGALFNFQFTLTINNGVKYRRMNKEISAIKRICYDFKVVAVLFATVYTRQNTVYRGQFRQQVCNGE
jgi:hypothetical protein